MTEPDTAPMGLEEIARLTAIARAATPGPWLCAEVVQPVRTGDGWADSGWSTELIGSEILGQDDVQVHSPRTGFNESKDAEFAGVFDPPTVLALLSEIVRLRGIIGHD